MRRKTPSAKTARLKELRDPERPGNPAEGEQGLPKRRRQQPGEPKAVAAQRPYILGGTFLLFVLGTSL